MNTVNHRFRLKGNDPTKPVGILYLCSINNQIFQYGVGYTIAPELWDHQIKRPTQSKTLLKEYKKHIPDIETQLLNISRRIDNICQEMEKYLSNARLNNQAIQFEDLRVYLDKTVKKSDQSKNDRKKDIQPMSENKQISDPNYILDFAESMIRDMINGVLLIKSGENYGLRYKSNTIKGYQSFLKAWSNFQKSTKSNYLWKDMNKGLYDQFIQYLNQEDLSANYIGKHIKNWKVIAKAAFDDNIHSNKTFRETWFKKISAKVENVCLTEDEVKKIENLDLSQYTTLDKARDLFLIGCYTAMRFSDIKRLNKNQIDGNFIKFTSVKNSKNITIPAGKRLMKMFQKYDYILPTLSEQKVNLHIKEIARMAGIDGFFERPETRGGKISIEKYRKYELITTHSGRRTAATQLYNHPTHKMAMVDIMAITGHSSMAVFEKYLCKGTSEQLERIQDHPYFK